ncbi:O-antigen polymerase [Vibrio splendidus]|uniref:O-antigen polymerase n=1 Tax=Vibrio splendidus TaxID=29497 RepID=UPI002236A8D8|nr:O-antigen polymerase [Vibrio splendidus]
MMFVDPRGWELAFGRYFFLNYIYFLHTLAVVFLIISFKIKGKVNWFDSLLIVLCVLSSTFHGVKFTVIHVFTFLIFTSLILNSYAVSKNVVISILILVLFFVIFFSFVRGGGVEGIVGYIVSASVNSMYKISNNSIFEMGSFGRFFPLFDPDLYSKILGRAGGEEFISKGVSDDSGFMLNNKYNLFSAITTLSLTGPVGFLFWGCILACMIRMASKLKNVFYLVSLTFLLHVLLMFFTAWEFYKYKLIFILIVSFIMVPFLKKDRPIKPINRFS